MWFNQLGDGDKFKYNVKFVDEILIRSIFEFDGRKVDGIWVQTPNVENTLRQYEKLILMFRAPTTTITSDSSFPLLCFYLIDMRSILIYITLRHVWWKVAEGIFELFTGKSTIFLSLCRLSLESNCITMYDSLWIIDWLWAQAEKTPTLDDS